jgi:hypothetical protein
VQPLWIAISIIAFIVIVVLLVIARGKPRPNPSNLAILGMALVVLGILFGDNRLIGYLFLGAGVLVSVVDIIRSRRK